MSDQHVRIVSETASIRKFKLLGARQLTACDIRHQSTTDEYRKVLTTAQIGKVC